jgi:iron complex outermembrane receptor protein
MRSAFAGFHSIRPRASALHLTASALALAMALPAVAVAQTASQTEDGATEVEEIVVTGLRRGLADSIATKRRETSIVEAVSAEDIGKLPDVSIAESIARLPGLAAQRVNGRAQVISIRGLAPDFTTTLLNGRQQASSGDNRAVEFDQYPSELLSGVVIYKTPDAEVSGMGLSGTADLQTVRPLAFGQRALAVNLRGEMTEGDKLNDDVRNYGGRFSISYIDQLADGTLGLALGYAHLDSPSQNKHYKAYGYEAFGGVCEPIAPQTVCVREDGTEREESVQPDSADAALLLNGQEIFATSRLNQRDAVIGILEWRPTDQLHSTLDVYYSKFEQEETTRGAQWFSNAWADDAYFTDVVTEDRAERYDPQRHADHPKRPQHPRRRDLLDRFEHRIRDQRPDADRCGPVLFEQPSPRDHSGDLRRIWTGDGRGHAGNSEHRPDPGRHRLHRERRRLSDLFRGPELCGRLSGDAGRSRAVERLGP